MLDTPAEDYHGGSQRVHQPPLYSEKVFADRKIFFMDLKENDRGRFVKITEDVRGRRDTIMLPAEALDDFLEALNRVADHEEELDLHPADARTNADPEEAEDKADNKPKADSESEAEADSEADSEAESESDSGDAKDPAPAED